MATRYNQTRINIEKKKDDNGFAYFDALAGGIGVLKYRENGKIIRELRHPDDVFQAESMQSLAMKPFTLQHEGGMVKPESATGVTRGATGENIRREGDFIACKVGVFDKKALDDIEDGSAIELSLGYSCDVENQPGEYKGEKYDRRQKNIRYNHLTGATVARDSGSRLRLNSEDPAALFSIQNEEKMDKLKIDKVEAGKLRFNSIEIEDNAENKLLLSQRDEAVTAYQNSEKSVSERDAKIDRLNSDNEELKKQVKDMVPADRLNSIVAKHTKVAELAQAAGVELSKDGNLEEIDRKAQIEMLTADESYDVERLNSDSVYLDAAWDLWANDERKAKLQAKRNLRENSNDPDLSGGSIDYTTKPAE